MGPSTALWSDKTVPKKKYEYRNKSATSGSLLLDNTKTLGPAVIAGCWKVQTVIGRSIEARMVGCNIRTL
jgi:hypothetical protein